MAKSKASAAAPSRSTPQKCLKACRRAAMAAAPTARELRQRAAKADSPLKASKALHLKAAQPEIRPAGKMASKAAVAKAVWAA
ncbi:hypothetical protein D3C73_1211440 [compost metagenome]